MTPELLFALLVPAALVVGALAGWLFHSRFAGSSQDIETRVLLERAQADAGRLEKETAALREQLSAARAETARHGAEADRVPSLEETISSLHQQLHDAHATRARLETQLAEGRQRLDEQKQMLTQLEAKFREAFQSLAAEALKSNNQAFLDLARTAMSEFQQGAKDELEARRQQIEQTVAPVKEKLDEFDKAVREIEKERVDAYSGLKEQVAALKADQHHLQSETANLVKALRAPTTRGRWGEYQLKRVVELAGMVENCDFTEQAHVPTQDGRLRPDVIVHLAGGKTTVIDAKVPLLAYLDAIQSDDEEARRAHLQTHARHVRTHVTQLGSKAYWDQLASSPDFVVMYVPMESAFTAALQEDPDLIDYAVSCRVIPCGPMTLLTHLKAAAYGWRQERIAESAQQISELGKQLYERLSTLAEHFNDVGKHLGQATEAYNAAAGSIERRVLVAARRFKELGAATGDDLPQLDPVGARPRALSSPELQPSPKQLQLPQKKPRPLLPLLDEPDPDRQLV